MGERTLVRPDNERKGRLRCQRCGTATQQATSMFRRASSSQNSRVRSRVGNSPTFMHCLVVLGPPHLAEAHNSPSKCNDAVAGSGFCLRSPFVRDSAFKTAPISLAFPNKHLLPVA